MNKWCFGKCDRCAWKYNGGCSEWRVEKWVRSLLEVE